MRNCICGSMLVQPSASVAILHGEAGSDAAVAVLAENHEGAIPDPQFSAASHSSHWFPAQALSSPLLTASARQTLARLHASAAARFTSSQA